MVLTIRSGVSNHPEQTVLHSLTSITRKGGLLSDSDLTVTEPAGGGLNIDVGTGRAVVKGTNAYPVINTTIETVAITANSSGNPRYSSIVLYIDLGATPDPEAQGSDVAKLASVDGVASSSPIIPSDATIQSIVGAGNPFIRLADVMVVDGATGISTGDITNINQRAFIQSFSGFFTLTYAATTALDFNNGNKQKITLTGNVTFTAPINMNIGDFIKLEIAQDGTGGRSVTWFAGITWLSPDISLNTNSGKKSSFVIEKTGATTYNGYLVGKEY